MDYKKCKTCRWAEWYLANSRCAIRDDPKTELPLNITPDYGCTKFESRTIPMTANERKVVHGH